MKRPHLAGDIMATDLIALRPDLHVFDGIAHLLRYDISGAPVVDEQRKYLGVFSEKCCMSVLTLTAQLSAQADDAPPPPRVQAADFMATRLVTLNPQTDVFDAIELLLRQHVSGAPVVGENSQFLGVLSERYGMRALVDAVFEQMPTSNVSAYMNRDYGRLIREDRELIDVAEMFLKTHYRRLVVVRDGRVVGQISRRDVLKAEHHLSRFVRVGEEKLLDNSEQIDRSDHAADYPPTRLPSGEVAAFMDTAARTITEETDLLGIAHIFLTTNYRRLPVLRDGRLVGQVSRRDLLQAIQKQMKLAPRREGNLLYLSSLIEREEAPFAS